MTRSPSSDRPVTEHDALTNPTPNTRGTLTRILDALSSVWLGVTFMFLLFVYMSVGSAGYVIRQSRWFEMTEYEWFHWWPFDALIAALCINLSIATIRRIPLRVVNLGVWMIHAGIIILCIGSVIYFSQKIEGDTPVFRRSIAIESPDHPALSLVALPGAHITAGEGDSQRLYEVVSTDPSWPILSTPDAGTRAYAVTVRVTRPDGSWFQRQLLDGYPQYTEDILNTGRAVNTTGKKLVDPELSMRLEPWAQHEFFLAHTWALYLRELTPQGAGNWAQRPLHNMPRYNDYIPSREDVFLDAYEAERRARLEPSPINVRARRAEPSDPAPEDVRVRVTGYLRYAVLNARFEQGPPTGPMLPVADVTLSMVGQAPMRSQIVASRAPTPGQSLPLRWVDAEADVPSVAQSVSPLLRFSFPGGAATEIPAIPVPSGDQTFTPLTDSSGADTGWSVRVREVIDDVPMADGAHLSIAVIDLASADTKITRWVADIPAYTRDFHDGPGDHGDLRAPNTALDVTYQPGRRATPVTLVAAPRAGRQDPALFAVVSLGSSEPTVRELSVGKTVDLGPMATLTVNAFWPRAQRIIKPAIVPVSQRDRDAESFYSMIKVEIESGGRTESQWVPYHQYVFPDDSYTYGSRFRFEPARFTLADGRVIEAMFSRERRPLPEPVTLSDFRLITHVGGFQGDVSSIRDWESVIRFADQPADDAMSVRTNAPASYAGLRFFQAMWDPPQRASDGAGVTSPGLNFTGLGVGSRTGVMTQLAGCILSTLGMLYAFYVKPIIKRRRKEAVYAEVRAGAHGESASARLAARNRAAEIIVTGNAQEEAVR